MGEGKPLDIGPDFLIEIRRSDDGIFTEWANIIDVLPLPPLDAAVMDSDTTDLTDTNGETLTDG